MDVTPPVVPSVDHCNQYANRRRRTVEFQRFNSLGSRIILTAFICAGIASASGCSNLASFLNPPDVVPPDVPNGEQGETETPPFGGSSTEESIRLPLYHQTDNAGAGSGSRNPSVRDGHGLGLRGEKWEPRSNIATFHNKTWYGFKGKPGIIFMPFGIIP